MPISLYSRFYITSWPTRTIYVTSSKM